MFIVDPHALALVILPLPALTSDWFVNVAATCQDISQPTAHVQDNLLNAFLHTNNINLKLIQCLIFHCRPLSRRSPARPASPCQRFCGAFLRPAEGSCPDENLNSSVYVYHANLQSENCETPVSYDNLLRDFLELRSNVCPISSMFSSESTWRVLWGFLSRTEPVSRNIFTFTNCISVRRTDIGESVSK